MGTPCSFHIHTYLLNSWGAKADRMPISRTFVAACLIGAALASAPTLADDGRRPDKVSFYFAAHEDDWQLFMNPSAFQDVINGAAKTVFVHLTAGDAGLGVGLGGRKHPFYLARENGAEAAIRFMADTDAAPGERIAHPMSFNGHMIYRVSYLNTAGYFLRVPDGHWSGDGYYETGFQSLKRLATGENDILRAVDGSATYHGWADLVDTLHAIVIYERERSTVVQINVAETNTRINPKDHSDHLMTAKAALEAVKDLSCVRRVYYVDYASSRLPQNLDAQQRDMESSVFAVTLAGVQALDHGTSWRHYDQAFVGRNYFRVQEPAGHCDTAVTTTAAARH
jgi:LmbE family N-acetylglucosaminyl deacetylase